jgi:hypothetical protein
MGELLRFYLGSGRDTSRAFWLGASRVLDSRPVLSGPLAERVGQDLAVDEVTVEDAWSTVGEELREALDHSTTHG